MPRAGRDRELLVALVEQLVAGTGFRVQSPEYVMGHDTQELKEIDVSLRGRIGSSDMFVMIECRDRRRTPDHTWVGEIRTKREDVRADRAIAVSSSGFSSGAQNLARKHNIELRTLRTVDRATVLGWMLPSTMKVRWQHFDLKRFGILFQSNDPRRAEIEQFLGEKLTDVRRFVSLGEQRLPLVRKTTGEIVSVEEILANTRADHDADLEPVFARSKATGQRQSVTIETHYVNPNDCFQAQLGQGFYDVRTIVLIGECWEEAAEQPASGLAEYRIVDGEVIARAQHFDVAMPDSSTVRFQLVGRQEGVDLAIEHRATTTRPRRRGRSR